MAEDPFVEEALRAAAEILDEPLVVRRGAALLYQITVNNRLKLVVNPKRPTRGQSAFQTDLCIFEKVSEGVEIPRVVMEFKPDISTHDVLTYSTKARKHKQVYPYLRYGSAQFPAGSSRITRRVISAWQRLCTKGRGFTNSSHPF